MLRTGAAERNIYKGFRAHPLKLSECLVVLERLSNRNCTLSADGVHANAVCFQENQNWWRAVAVEPGRLNGCLPSTHLRSAICRSPAAIAVAPTAPILLPQRLYNKRRHRSAQRSHRVTMTSAARTHLSTVSVWLCLSALPMASVPLTPILLLSKLCSARKREIGATYRGAAKRKKELQLGH